MLSRQRNTICKLIDERIRYHGVDRHVGKTPLIRLRRLSELTRCEILGKAEFMNPGGSVKDRIALSIIEDAEARGLLKSGGTIVEGTGGNTGIGLTVMGHARGYRSLIVIPETQSREKIDLLRTLGAEVLIVPEKPPPSRQLQPRCPAPGGGKGLVLGEPFDNTANRLAHYRTTGPEIWEQTAGQVRLFPRSVQAARWPEPRGISRSAIQESSSAAPIPTARLCGRGSPTATRTRTTVIPLPKASANRGDQKP